MTAVVVMLNEHERFLTAVLDEFWIGEDLLSELEPVLVLLLLVAFLCGRKTE